MQPEAVSHDQMGAPVCSLTQNCECPAIPACFVYRKSPPRRSGLLLQPARQHAHAQAAFGRQRVGVAQLQRLLHADSNAVRSFATADTVLCACVRARQHAPVQSARARWQGCFAAAAAPAPGNNTSEGSLMFPCGAPARPCAGHPWVPAQGCCPAAAAPVHRVPC